MLLRTSAKLPGLLPEAGRLNIAAIARREQQADGGWTLQALGPWSRHQAVPPADGSNAYATALVAFALQQSGLVARTDHRSSKRSPGSARTRTPNSGPGRPSQ